MLSRIVLLTALLAVLLFAPGAAQVPTPQNLTATVVDGPAVQLAWDAPAGLWLYKVYRAGADGAGLMSIGVAGAARYTDNGVVPGESYTYAVAATGLAGGSVVEGAKSAPVAVAVPPSTTQGVVAGKVTDETDGTGIPYAQVLVVSTTDTTRWVQVVTDLKGQYKVVLDPGTYLIHVQPPYSSLRSWQAEWYENAADRTQATPVVVAAGATLTINIALGSGAGSTALLQLIHNAADPAAATVDIYLDSVRVLNDFAFRQATPFLALPAGVPLTVSIAPGTSTGVGDAVKSLTVTLDSGKVYLAIANGVLDPTGFAANPDGRPIAFAVITKTPALTSGSGGNVHLAVLHGATDAPTVDVVARGVGTLVDNAAYGDLTDYLAVPPAAYTLDVKDGSGSVTVASFVADLSGLANGAAVVFASGFLDPAANKNGPAFGLYAALPSGVVVALPPEGTPQADQGVIAGTVDDEVTGTALEGAKVMAFRTGHATPMAAWTKTGADGSYALQLPAGAYYLRVEPPVPSATGPNYLPEWYDNAVTVLNATAVTVVSGDTITVDVGLTPVIPPVMVGIAGTITSTAGEALAGAHVVVMRSVQETAQLACMPGTVPADLGSSVVIESVGECHGVVWVGTTDAAGAYRATVPGNHAYIVMAAKKGYVPEYYNDRSSPLTADRIVMGTADTAGIDLALSPVPGTGVTISGFVKDAQGHGVPARVIALMHGISPLPVVPRFGHADSTGAFTIKAVVGGKCILMAIPYCGYAPAFYREGAYGVLSWKDAEVVTIGDGVAGITIGVVPLKSRGVAVLAGLVRSATRLPIKGVFVSVRSALGEVLGYAMTDAEGTFAIPGVAAGPVNIAADAGGFDPAMVSIAVPDGSPMISGIEMTLSGTTVGTEDPDGLPSAFGLLQNYPNPFNPSTQIGVDVPSESRVMVTVFNVLGERVATVFEGNLTAGRHMLQWDGRDGRGGLLPSGVYLYRLEAWASTGEGAPPQVRKMLLVR